MGSPFRLDQFFVVVVRQKMVTNLDYTGGTSPLTRSVADFAAGVELQTKNLPSRKKQAAPTFGAACQYCRPGTAPGPDAPDYGAIVVLSLCVNAAPWSPWQGAAPPVSVAFWNARTMKPAVASPANVT